MDTSLLTEARAKIPDIIEEIGNLALALREATEFAANGNVPAAAASINDALEAIDNTRRDLAFLRLGPGRWAVWAEGLPESQTEAVAP